MVIGVKFKVKPGEQWTIRRDVYQKVRDLFNSHGIIFAQRSVVVQVRKDDETQEGQIIDSNTQEMVTAAAQDAIEQKLVPEK